MRILKIIIFLHLILTYQIFSQSVFVHGIVKGENILPGVLIKVLEDSNSTITNKFGEYSLKLKSPGNYTISFSHLGYRKRIELIKIEPNKNFELNVVLERKPINIGEAVVTSSRNESYLKENPLSIEVISESQFENSNKITLSDLAGNNAGISVVKDSPWGTNINIRGLTNQNIVYLIDNYRVETSTNIAAGISLINMNNISDVEVVKGGISALYGSGATGGVINIKTKKPKYENNFYIKPTIISSYGSVNDLNSQFINLSTGYTNWSILASGSFRKASNTETPKGELLNSGFRDESIDIVTKYNPSNNLEIKLNYNKFSAYDVGIPGGVPFPAKATAKYVYAKREMLNGEINYSNITKELIKLKLKFYHQIIDRSVEVRPNPNAVSRPKAKHTNDGITFQGDWIFSGQNYFLAGIDFWQRKYNGIRRTTNFVKNIIKVDKPIPNSKFLNIGIFAQDDINILNNLLSLTIGGRYDYINITNDETKNPLYIINEGNIIINIENMAASYSAYDETNQSFSGNIGILIKLTNQIDFTMNSAYTFRSPSLEERYQYIDLGGIVYLGNPSLKPEKGFSNDLGFRIWNDKFTVRCNGFLNLLTNLVNDKIVSPDSLFKKQNVGKARLYGFDFSTEYNFNGNNKFYTNASFVRGEDLIKNSNLNQIPPFHGIIGLEYYLMDFTKIKLSANIFNDQNLVAENENTSGGYTTFDIMIESLPINLNCAELKLIGGIDNIFNRAYRNHLSTYRGMNLLEPGRNFTIKLILNIE